MQTQFYRNDDSMRIAFFALILILSISTVFFYLQTRHLQQLHEQSMANMQERLDRAEDECQVEIARLQDRYETRLAQKEASTSRQAGPRNIMDVLTNIQNRSQAVKNDLVLKAKKELNMDQETFSAFSQVIDEYESNKKSVLALSRSDKKPFFHQRYLDMLAGYKREAMTSLEQVLTSVQMQTFLDKNLDQTLGLQNNN